MMDILVIQQANSSCIIVNRCSGGILPSSGWHDTKLFSLCLISLSYFFILGFCLRCESFFNGMIFFSFFSRLFCIIQDIDVVLCFVTGSISGFVSFVMSLHMDEWRFIGNEVFHTHKLITEELS